MDNNPQVRKISEEMHRYLENSLLIASQYTETHPQNELLHPVVAPLSNETGETLLRGSDKAAAPDQRKQPLWRRLFGM